MMLPAPVGVSGELCLAGVGLARGYVNLPSVTAERFVPDPFSSDLGARLYRTGDLARWNSDGLLEFLGRIDQQIKIRGHRIEPGEIEAWLRARPEVQDAAVVAQDGQPGGKRLVAYVVTRDGALFDRNGLRDYLERHLPDYMVPSTFVSIDALPLTPNGKLDRKALPRPESVVEAPVPRPRTLVEEVMCGIWASALDVDNIGLEDDFFELGGHSLLAAQVVTQIQQIFHIEIGLQQIFETPTVAGLAELIEMAFRSGRAGGLAAFESVERNGPVPQPEPIISSNDGAAEYRTRDIGDRRIEGHHGRRGDGSG
jgi:acyl carrier protein